jgi:hypothetical protein
MAGMETIQNLHTSLGLVPELRTASGFSYHSRLPCIVFTLLFDSFLREIQRN